MADVREPSHSWTNISLLWGGVQKLYEIYWLLPPLRKRPHSITSPGSVTGQGLLVDASNVPVMFIQEGTRAGGIFLAVSAILNGSGTLPKMGNNIHYYILYINELVSGTLSDRYLFYGALMTEFEAQKCRKNNYDRLNY